MVKYERSHVNALVLSLMLHHPVVCDLYFTFSVCPLLSGKRPIGSSFGSCKLAASIIIVFSFFFFEQENNRRRTFELVLSFTIHPRPWENSPKIVRSSVRKSWCKSKFSLVQGLKHFSKQMGPGVVLP